MLWSTIVLLAFFFGWLAVSTGTVFLVALLMMQKNKIGIAVFYTFSVVALSQLYGPLGGIIFTAAHLALSFVGALAMQAAET